MTYTVLNTRPATRITLLDAAGQGQVRWTLQASAREGREVRFKPEGTLHLLGSGADRRRRWIHNGFRQELAIKWAYGLTSTRETWTGMAWSAPVERPTAEAHGEILDWSEQWPVQVEPFLGQPMPAFTAQGTERGPSLADTKGVAHPALELALVAVALSVDIQIVQGLGWGLGPFGLLAWGD